MPVPEQLACTKCGKRAWSSQDRGDDCQWSYHGIDCDGVIADANAPPPYEPSEKEPP